MKDDDVIKTYGNTSAGAMYLATLDSNASCNALKGCRLAKRNALQRTLIEGSKHGIPISFVTESLHSPMAKLRQPAPPALEAETPCDKVPIVLLILLFMEIC